MDTANPWITLAQASTRHGKSIATIRRWVTLPQPIRTHMSHGTRYVHETDIAAVAAAHPAPIPPGARAACAEAGHQPDTTTIGDLGAGDWLTLGVAGRAVSRSKSTLTLWIRGGEIRSVHCECTWRRFVWRPDLDATNARHQYKRKARS
jgi:hypothetical protein